MRVIGLTGGIGMGKSTAGAEFRRQRIPVFDADAVVHRLQGPGGAALVPIAAAFPGVVADGVLDRARLRRALTDPAALTRLERIVHPLVRRAERAFLARARASRRAIAVLDVPLLFETGGDGRVDHVMVVSAPATVQRARVVARGRMTSAQVDAVIRRQLPDAERRRRADTVIRTGLSRFHAVAQIRRTLARLRAANSHTHRA